MPRPEASLPLAAYLEHLRELPFARGVRVARGAPGAGGRRWDAEVVLKTPTGSASFACDVARGPITRASAERAVDAARGVDNVLVLAPSVAREAGELLQKARVNFVDLAGNCHVRVGDRYLARIQGLRAPAKPPVDKPLRAAAYRALFALLAEAPLLQAPVRAIATKAGGVSPQTAADLRTRLVEQGFVLRARGRYRWSPTGWRHALDLWLAGYATTLAPRLVVGRFRAREQEVTALEERLASSLGDRASWRWGGGAAAQRLTGYYRGDRTVLYLAQVDPELPRRLALVRDAAGPVVLLQAPGPVAFQSAREDTAHPLLVYADLLAEGHDRAREAAHVLFDRYLRELEVAS